MRRLLTVLVLGYVLGVGSVLAIEPAKTGLTRPESFGCKAMDDGDTLACTGYGSGVTTTYLVRGMRDMIAEIGTDQHDDGATIDCRFYYGGFVRECSFAVG